MKCFPNGFCAVYFSARNESWSHMPDVPAVVFPYQNENFDIVGLKFRLSESSHDTRWDQYKKAYPYGVHHVEWKKQQSKLAGLDPDVVGYGIVLVEGESDQQTLSLNDIPALGISGKNAWQPEFADIPLLKNAKYILVVQEPEAENFPVQIAESFPNAKVYAVSLPVKDPSELWIRCGYRPKSGAQWLGFREAHEAFLKSWSEALTNAKILCDGQPCTDTGNAKRMVEMFGENFRVMTNTGGLPWKFRTWNGQVWNDDSHADSLLAWTSEVVSEIPNEEWREKSQSAGKRHAMIDMTKGETPVLASPNQFNLHPMLLNVRNGTIDLETQRLREFCREDFLTQQSATTYIELVDCPKFDEFLDFIFDHDKDVIHYVVKALGYTLTGRISEQCVFFCHGSGKNGKTTLLELVQKFILGPDYAKSTNFSTFVANKFSSDNYDMANFASKRLVMAAEVAKGKQLNEQMIKYLSGDDQVNARMIFKAPINFYPECKLWLLMNDLPWIEGTDEGIWRRIRYIPFKVQIPDALRVKEFHKVLFEEEGPGILNRLLGGVRDWLEEGLIPPRAVAEASAEFRESMDTLKDFFGKDTTTGKGLRVKAGDLYAKYKTWAETNNEILLRQNEFKEEVERRGFQHRRIRAGKFWYGITLKSAPQEVPLEDEGVLSFDAPGED